MASQRIGPFRFDDEVEDEEYEVPGMTEREWNQYIEELEEENPGCTGYSNQFD